MTYEKAKGYIGIKNNFILTQNLRKNLVEILKRFNVKLSKNLHSFTPSQAHSTHLLTFANLEDAYS